MTKTIMDIKDNGEIFFDCENHAGDHDICTVASTLCNVLVVATQKRNFDIDVYEDGHVRIYIPVSEEPLREVFRAVRGVFRDLAEQTPEHLKIY